MPTPFSLNVFNTTAGSGAASAVCSSTSRAVCDDGGCGGGDGDALLIDGTNAMLADANIGNNALLNVTLTEFDELGSIPTPDPGQISIYANSNDRLMHYVDDTGTDLPIAVPANIRPTSLGELESYVSQTYSVSPTQQQFSHLQIDTTLNMDYINDPGTGNPARFKILEAGTYRISALIFSAKISGSTQEITYFANINASQIPFASAASSTDASSVAGTILTELSVGDEFWVTFASPTNTFDVAFTSVNFNLQRIAESIQTDNPFDQSLNTDDNVTFDSLQMPLLATTTTANTDNLKLYFNEDDELLHIRTGVDDPDRPDFVFDNGVDYSGVTEEVYLKNSDVDNVKTLTATTLKSQNLVNKAFRESVSLLDERCQGPGFQGSPTVTGGVTLDTVNKQITFPPASSLSYNFPNFLTAPSTTRVYSSWDQPVYAEGFGAVTLTYGLSSTDLTVFYSVVYSAGEPVYTIRSTLNSVVLGTLTLANPLGYLELKVSPGGSGSLTFRTKTDENIVSYNFNHTFTNPNSFSIDKAGDPTYRVSTLQVFTGTQQLISFIADKDAIVLSSAVGSIQVTGSKVDVTTNNLRYSSLLLNNKIWPFSHSFSSFTYTLVTENTLPAAGQLSFNSSNLTTATQLQMNTSTGRGQALTDVTSLFPLGQKFYVVDVNEKGYGFEVTGAPTVNTGVLTVACVFSTRTTTSPISTSDTVTISFAPESTGGGGTNTVVAEFESTVTVGNLGITPWIIPVAPNTQTIDDISELVYTQVAIGGATGTVISGFTLDKIYSFNTYLPITKVTIGQNNTIRLAMQVSTTSPPSSVSAANSVIIASGITTIFGDANNFSGINWSIRVTDFFKCTDVNQKIWFSGEAIGAGTVAFGGVGVNSSRIQISTTEASTAISFSSLQRAVDTLNEEVDAVESSVTALPSLTPVISDLNTLSAEFNTFKTEDHLAELADRVADTQAFQELEMESAVLKARLDTLEAQILTLTAP